MNQATQLCTVGNVMTLGTTVSESRQTVGHFRLQMNAQWSTTNHVKVLGTTLTSVIVYNMLLLGMQNGCIVVYCGMVW